MKVLVICADPDFRQILVDWLFMRGDDARVLNSESLTVFALKQGQYDVVLFDLVTPSANSFTLISQMRRLCPKTHVIVISAVADICVAIEAARVGAEACLVKPLEFPSLEYELSRLERSRSLESSPEPPLRHELLKT